jgi:hypothetical protein
MRKNTLKLYTSPGGNRVDPFDMLPISGRGNPQYIIMQCKQQDFREKPALARRFRHGLRLQSTILPNKILPDRCTKTLVVQTSLIFSTCLSSPVGPDTQKRNFLAYAISDPALLHAWLASIAKALCTLCGSNLHSEIDYHVSRAISIVNNRIANSHHTQITKETIMAVTYLTNVGVRYMFSLEMTANTNPP